MNESLVGGRPRHAGCSATERDRGGTTHCATAATPRKPFGENHKSYLFAYEDDGTE